MSGGCRAKGKLVVGNAGRRWAVWRDGERVSCWYSNREYAETRREAMRRAEQKKPRPCLCCGERFKSDGPHNRLCKACGRRTAEPDLAVSAGGRGPAIRSGRA